MGGSLPATDVLLSIIHKFCVSPAWLMLGEGPMLCGSNDPSKQEYPAPDKAVSDSEAPIPCFESAAAGPDGRLVSDNPSYWLPRPHGVNERELYAIEVSGCSMEPAYRAGDVVYITPITAPREGDHVVLAIRWQLEAPEVLLKVWTRMDAENVRLSSLNPDYPPIVVPVSDVLRKCLVVSHMWAKNARNARVDKKSK